MRIAPLTKRAGIALICIGLGVFYVIAASEHARRVNTSKARGDQTGYLWDAENVYANWHGKQPPVVIGERNRMPLYAGFLALLYHRDLSDPEFFEVAKRANIYLSLGLLVLLGILFARELPPLAAANLTGIVTFGIFIFKAGYAQSELLFYFLLFVTFLGCWHLLRGASGRRAIILAALSGLVAALAQLTKAAMLPFVAIFLAVYVTSAIVRRKPAPTTAGVAALAFALVFFAVLWPYLSTSKRVFGQYFYNVNSTFYVWYDDWAHASVGTYSHGDGVGWPTMPAAELPSASRYVREHTIRQIAARIASGFQDIAIKSVQMYDYLPYLILYLAAVLVVLATRRSMVVTLLKSQLPLVVFLLLYAAVYLLAIAFYFPTSGTGTARFLLAHLTPFFFAASALLSSASLEAAPWRLGDVRISLRHFHLLILVVISADVAFHVWPRLMNTYGGF